MWKNKRPFDSKTRMTTRMRFPQYLVVHTCEPASFWRENAMAVVVIILRGYHIAIGRPQNKKTHSRLNKKTEIGGWPDDGEYEAQRGMPRDTGCSHRYK